MHRSGGLQASIAVCCTGRPFFVHQMPIDASGFADPCIKGWLMHAALAAHASILD